MESLLNDTQESEDRLDTSRSSASEDAVVSPRSKDSNSSSRIPFALHIDVNNKENDKGEKSTAPNSRSTSQNKNTNNTKKPKTPTETPSLRAPYAQPVLDASKLHNNDLKKSTTEERLASARGRRLQQQKQFAFGNEDAQPESDLKSRREREDQAYAKWMQTQEEKRRKIEENKMKDGAHRREVEQRKKIQLEGDKKKAEAKIAKNDQQVSEVKMRQKRSASTDRTKRWSWGAGAVGGSGGFGYGDSPSPFHYFDATRMTKRTHSAGKQRPRSMHASHFDVSRLGIRFDEPSEQLKSGSLSNLASPSASKTNDERFSKSPLLINTTHMTFVSGLRSYETNSGAGRGSPDSPRIRRSNSLGARPKKLNNGPPVRTASVENIASTSEQTITKPPNTRGRSAVPKVTLTTTAKIREQLAKNLKGRTHTSPGLTEPITISPRLLAPTRASLARSRNAINDLDDSTSQSSTGSGSHGPMRSRSKDRRVKETQQGRSESGGSSPQVDGTKSTPPLRKPTPERKSTPTRGSSPMVPNRRAPSPAKRLPSASSGLDSKSTTPKSANENDKVKKRGVSPHARSYRAPSPAKAKSTTDLSTPPRTASRRGASPSPATTRTKTKVQNDPKPVSTPPSIKPSLRPTSTQLKTKLSSPSSKTPVQKTTKPASKTKQETPKEAEKPEDIKETKEKVITNSTSDSGYQESPNPSTTDPKSPLIEAPKVVSTGEIPKSSSNTSQTVSEIPTSEAEDLNLKEHAPGQLEAEKDALTTNVQEPSPLAEEGKSTSIKDPSQDQDASSVNHEDEPIVTKDSSSDQDASSAAQENDSSNVGVDTLIITEDPSMNQDAESDNSTSTKDRIEDQDASSTKKDELSRDKDPQLQSSSVKVESPQIVDEIKELNQDTEVADVQKSEDPQIIVSTEDKIDVENRIRLGLEEDAAKDSLEDDVVNDRQDSLLDSFKTVEPVDPRAVSPVDSLEEYEPDNNMPVENSLQNELDSAEYLPPDNFDSEESDSEEQISVKERIQSQDRLEDSEVPESQIIEESTSSDQPMKESTTETVSDKPEDKNTGGQLPEDEERSKESQLPEPIAQDSQHLQNFDAIEREFQLLAQASNQHLEVYAPSTENHQLEEKLPVTADTSNQEDPAPEKVVEDIKEVDQEIPQKEDEEEMEKHTGSLSPEDSNGDPSQPTQNEIEVSAPVANDENVKTSSEDTETVVNENNTNQLVEAVEEKSQKLEDVSPPVEAETAPANEKKSMPRKNLETDEEKEAYRQAIADKRRELKEKKEQEERERQERIRLAKIEQAKREEEARRMFEEAEATAVMEKKMREEEAKRAEEEERKKEEEANNRKREAAEKVKKDREAAKQKQEDERLARKKRLEMIMRRTRQPDASDSDKPKTDGSLTPSPQHTPITLSPASGRSPQTQSPVGGKSPLTATTPERSVSPAVAAILNRSNDSSSPTPLDNHATNAADTNGENLLNFSNSTKNFDTGVELIKIDNEDSVSNIDKPVPFEAFTVKPLANGVSTESNNYSNNKDPFNLFSNENEEIGQQSTNQDLLSINNDLIQQKTDPMVPTGI